MKSKFLKLFSGFLTITLLFGQMVNVKAYDETLNLSDLIDGLQDGKINESNYVLLRGSLATEGAKVYQQYVKITGAEFETITAKQAEGVEYLNANIGNSLTPEISNQIEQNKADVNKLIPIFDDTKWTELTLSETTVDGNKYNVPLPDNIAYMVSWTKVVVGDTEYYHYFLYCYEETTPTKYICEIKDGKFYDKDGNEVTQEKYEEDCTIKSCSIKDGKYYGKDAEEVTEEVYRQQCGYFCKIVDGKYYDKDGNEVTEEVYRQQCGYFCKIVDGKYYDNKGDEVTETEYRRACGNPKTGITNYYMIGGAFIVLAGLGYALVRNKKLFSK